ncbi:MAG: hypothetical protein VCD00_19215 [Candidatus Hydrogenedentota bacterium]
MYRLEKAGLLHAQWEDGTTPRRGPRRRIYSITAKGIKELVRRREDWRQFVNIIGPVVEATT